VEDDAPRRPLLCHAELVEAWATIVRPPIAELARARLLRGFRGTAPPLESILQ
jgi:hypothetical protein